MVDNQRVATQYASKAANAATAHNDEDLKIDIMKELTFIDNEHEDEDLENTDLSNFNYELSKF